MNDFYPKLGRMSRNENKKDRVPSLFLLPFLPECLGAISFCPPPFFGPWPESLQREPEPVVNVYRSRFVTLLCQPFVQQ